MKWFKNKQQFQNLLVYIRNNIIIITVFSDLPPPPPEAFDQLEDSNEKHNMQSRSFKVLQDAVEHGGKYVEYIMHRNEIQLTPVTVLLHCLVLHLQFFINMVQSSELVISQNLPYFFFTCSSAQMKTPDKTNLHPVLEPVFAVFCADF